jgi:glutamyl-Q tRNA(Asp) synthetase
VGSYLGAKSAGGNWLLRIEDIDPAREVAGSASRIINDLCNLGLVPDGPVLYQSSRLDVYQQVVNRLLARGLAYSSGDFIIRRADGLFAYQLAVVVDDDFQGVTKIVRGADLLDSTNRQICLQKALGFAVPDYMHLPVAASIDGKKRSKRTQTDPVKHQNPAYAVEQALLFLGQNPPTGSSLDVLWAWALEHWNNALIPRRKAILAGELSALN